METTTLKDANKAADEMCSKWLDKPESKFVRLSVEGFRLILAAAYMRGAKEEAAAILKSIKK